MRPLALAFALALVTLAACTQPPAADETTPGFSLPDLDGKLHDLGDWKGQVVLVNFLASWCPPCMREIPLLANTQERYGPQGLQIVGIAVEDAEQAREFVERLQPPFPVLAGGIEAATLSKRYGNEMGALPYSVLIGRDGRILRSHTGELFEATLEDWLSGAL